MGRGWTAGPRRARIVVVATFALAQATGLRAVRAGRRAGGRGPVPRRGDLRERVRGLPRRRSGTGGVGPALVETGLDAAQVSAVVQQGRGVMPAGIVSGQEQADVVAYVVSISSRLSRFDGMEVEARIVRLPLAETFVIAREAADYADVVHVSLTHEGVTGYGEAAPVERYGESAQSASAVRRRPRQARRRRPVRARGHRRAPRVDRRRAGGEGGARRRAPRSAGEAPRRAGVPGSSACREPARRPRGRCGSAIRTTWRVARRRRQRRSDASSSSSGEGTASTSSACGPCARRPISR